MDISGFIDDRLDALRRLPGPSRSRIGTGLIALLVLALLYYPVGMAIMHKIDDDTGFTAEVENGASASVAVATELIRRETVDKRWVAMDPFFLPGSALDNMPNFQQGMVSAISRFAIEMSDQIGRVRGSSQVDEDLDKAVGFLKYKGDVWVFNIGESLLPTRSSAEQYRHGMEAFARYNKRLAEGNAVFDRRADNLLATLERFSADIGSASAVLDNSVRDLSALSFSADDVFYNTKGRLYAYYMLMRELRVDFAPVIQEKRLDAVWGQTLDSLRQAAEMDPLVVINGSPDGLIGPSHLAAQGFYLLRARTQIREIMNILLK